MSEYKKIDALCAKLHEMETISRAYKEKIIIYKRVMSLLPIISFLVPALSLSPLFVSIPMEVGVTHRTHEIDDLSKCEP